MIQNTEYDHMGTRYRQVANDQPGKFNWLFLPCGPGADASYFETLLSHITIPGNGSNINESTVEYDFEKWEQCFSQMLSRYKHPIIVGHSFGAMYPLLFPEIENLLDGLVILSSAPCLWLEEAAKLAKGNNISVLTEDMQAFEDNSNQDTFDKALLACLPYYFPAKTLEQGKALLEKLPFNYHAGVCWLRKAGSINFTAKWIPQEIPTLIIGGDQDYITPISLFEQDKRFQRDNIILKKINQAGHFPWIEDPAAVIATFKKFQSKLLTTAKI